jgi:hypothetical protein
MTAADAAGPDRTLAVGELARQRREMADQLTPEEFTRLQQHRAEAISALSPGQLAELQRRRRQLLPEHTS